MDEPNVDGQANAGVYGKDHAFDLKVGMAVHGPGGDRIGHVTQVEGFGSGRIGTQAEHGVDTRVTDARSGTGFFKVAREDRAGPTSSDLCIPFHGIQEVTAENGVILNGTAISDLRPAPGKTAPASIEEAASRPGGWRKWLPGRRLS